MPHVPPDTIAALATPATPAARLILRTSGPAAFELAERLGAIRLTPGRATPVRLDLLKSGPQPGPADAELPAPRIPATCYAFAAPRSHTGQDVVEYHLPGNPLLGRLLLDELIRLGARRATPGEFSARAFFNGKIRLDEAEGTAAAIAAGNDRQLAAARRLRAGELARRLEPAIEELADLLALCELEIDFTEEDVTVLEPAEAMARLAGLRQALAALRDDSARLEDLAQPPHIALVGRPNAGKSTLLNALAGYQRAVASTQAGTTRDILHATLELPGGPVQLVDLAGLTDHAATPIEAAALEHARRAAATADLLLLVRDITDVRPDPPLPAAADLVILTKSDLPNRTAPPTPPDPAGAADSGPPSSLSVSAHTGHGLAELKQRLDALAFSAAGPETLALTSRHAEQLALAISALDDAAARLRESAGAELVALHLREGLDALGAILGTITPDDLLGRIFGRFCIGK